MDTDKRSGIRDIRQIRGKRPPSVRLQSDCALGGDRGDCDSGGVVAAGV